VGSHLGSTTDDAGRYRLSIPAATKGDSVTLIARRIGFMPATRRIAIRADSAMTLDFELKPATVSLEGVVVTGAATATRPGTPAAIKDMAKSTVARREAGAEEARDKLSAAPSAVAKARADGSRVGRGGAANQEPRAGVLTAAVWDDAQHWPQYSRFLGRAQEHSWNPWGLDIGQNTVRPTRVERRPRSPRRARDHGFLVDAPRSRGGEIAFIQSELKDIVRRVRAVEPDLDIRMSVVFYRDRGDAFITKSLPFTRNADEAVAFISGTTADGGGDFPEDMNAGLEAMMRQRWSRDAVPQMLFLLADAPPQQYAGQDYTYHEAIQDAAASGIAIYPVAASGVDKPTEFLFRAMAVMTGGKYVFLTDDSGVGNSHEEPDITGYTVEKLNDLMVREIRTYVATHTTQPRVAENR
jgi:Mg-chelatase subunit ChlD